MPLALAILDPSLEVLLGVLLLIGSWVACGTVVPWIAILVHEAGHVFAVHATGARPVEAHVGHGARVLVVPCLGTRWNLRLWPSHGLVILRRPDRGWTPRREIVVMLAGPLASTALAVGFATLAFHDVGFPEGQLRGLARGAEGAVDLLAWALLLQAASTWMVGMIEIGGVPHPSDMLNVLRMLQLRPGGYDGWLESLEHGNRALDCWELHLAGRHAEALDHWRGLRDHGDEGATYRIGLPLYLWPVEGPASAMAASDVALESIAQLRSRGENGTTVVSQEERAQLDESEWTTRLNRAFFAVLAGGEADRLAADAWLRAELHRRPKDAVLLRTRGFVDLEMGAVETGVRRLQRAWKLEETAWGRSLCALYLAHGHALRGDRRRARKFLAKSQRLYAQSVMLPVLVPRIEARLEARG